MMRPAFPVPDPLRRAAATTRAAWHHPRWGWIVKGVVAWIVLVEIGVQALFGRVGLGPVSLGRRPEAVPREVLVGGMVIGALYALVGMGLILVYRGNRIINFAQAQLGAVPAVVALLLIAKRGWPYLGVLPIVIVGAAILGGVSEVAFVRRFASAPRLILTVVTIGIGFLLLILEFYAKQWVGGQLIDTVAFDYRTPVSGFRWRWGVQSFTGDHVMTVVVVGAIVVALGAFFRFTDMGIAVRASAENGERASLLGIPVKRVSTVVWMLAAVLSAIGVFLRGPLVGIPLSGFVGPSILLFGLAAAVIARMDSLPICFGAGLLIGVIDRAAIFSTRRAALASAVMFVVIVVALLAQRARLSRAFDTGTSTWQTVREFRPIPAELRRVPEVIWGRAGLAVLLGALALFLPQLLGDRKTPEATLMVVYAIVGVSLVVLTGWTGQISLGQYAIAGVGSAVAGGLAANHNWDFFAAVFTGAMVGAAVSVVIGLPALRIQGLFLAVTTLAFAFAVQNFVLKREFFGWLLPRDGTFIARPILWGWLDLTTETRWGPFRTTPDAKFYYLCLAFLVLVLAMARSLRVYRSGRIFIGVRDNGRMMQAFGVNLAATRLAAFAISGWMAGLAGALLAYQNTVFSPGGFSPEKSIELFIMTVIGGMGALPGALLGAAYVVGVPLLPGLRDVRLIEFLTSGLGLLLLLLVLPGGLAEGAYRLRDGLLRRVATRRGILVPSLVADTRAETPDLPLAHAAQPAPEPAGVGR